MSTHDHSGSNSGDDLDVAQHFGQSFWDERYASSQRVWSGNPNARLVEHLTGVTPGTALDVGCGEGADVVWLAQQGWRVTGVDISPVALEKAARHAQEAGVAERTAFAPVDLMSDATLPGGAEGYDLVSAQFLHLPPAAFVPAYEAMAHAVRPGGRLLVCGHHPDDAATGLRNVDLSHLLFAPDRVTDLLDDATWEVLVAASPTRVERHGDDEPVPVTDTVVLARKRP